MAQLASELHIEDMDQHGTQISAESRIQSSPAMGISSPVARALSPALDSHHEQAPQREEKAAPSQATTASMDYDDLDKVKGTENTDRKHQVIDLTLEGSESSQNIATQDRSIQLKRNFEVFAEGSKPVERTGLRDKTADEDDSHLLDSQDSSISAAALETRRAAFNSALQESNPDRWAGLLCTTNNHTREENELGEE